MNELLAMVDGLSSRLLWTSLHAAILGLLIDVLLRLRPNWPAKVSSRLWWLLGVQVLAGLLLPAAVPLPLWPAAARPPVWVAVAGTATPVAPLLGQHDPAPPFQPTLPSLPTESLWALGACALWALVSAGLLLQLACEWQRTRRLVRLARELPDDHLDSTRLHRLGAEIAQQLGLRTPPLICFSATIRSPQVSGAWRPVILIPAGQSWSDAELRLMLGHEMAHIQRGDLWLGWIPALAERLLWFHPLLRRATRLYLLNRELACDQQALQLGEHGSTALYGRLLLQVGVEIPAAGRLLGASSSFLQLRQRLLALQQSRQARWNTTTVAVTLLITICGAVPYQVTAAAGGSYATASHAQLDQPPAPPPPPAAPAVPGPPPPPPPPAAPAVPGPPPPPDIASSMALPSPTKARNPGPDYVLIDPTVDHSYVEANASQAELSQLQAMAAHSHRALWWSRQGGAGYLVLDPQEIWRVKQIFAPVSNYWSHSGSLTGRYWSARGQLQGLASWGRSIYLQQQDLLADQGPDRSARERDLLRQARQVQVRSDRLWQQLQGIHNDIAADQRQGAQILQQASQQASQLLAEAIANGHARRYDLNH